MTDHNARYSADAHLHATMYQYGSPLWHAAVRAYDAGASAAGVLLGTLCEDVTTLRDGTLVRAVYDHTTHPVLREGQTLVVEAEVQHNQPMDVAMHLGGVLLTLDRAATVHVLREAPPTPRDLMVDAVDKALLVTNGNMQVRRSILEAFVDAFATELGAAGFAMAKVPTSGASAFDLISNDPAARSALGLTTEGQDG